MRFSENVDYALKSHDMALVPGYNCFAEWFVPRNDFVIGRQDKQLALRVDLGPEHPVMKMNLEPIATICQH
jgi:hypothetical protein